LIREFEAHYTRVYTRSARFPEAGFFIGGAAAVGSVVTTRPVVPVHPLGTERPAAAAGRGTRRVYWKGRWQEAQLWEMERLEAGNVVEGFAIVEDPATTFVVPPGMRASLDEYRIFHLRDR